MSDYFAARTRLHELRQRCLIEGGPVRLVYIGGPVQLVELMFAQEMALRCELLYSSLEPKDFTVREYLPAMPYWALISREGPGNSYPMVSESACSLLANDLRGEGNGWRVQWLYELPDRNHERTIPMLTHSMLLQILQEAEARAADTTLPEDVRTRSSETVSLCKERMAKEGLTRERLEELARA